MPFQRWYRDFKIGIQVSNSMRMRAKWAIWQLLGPSIIRLVEKYATDKAFAEDPAFLKGWSDSHLVIESLEYGRQAGHLGLLPNLVGQLALRPELYSSWQAHGASITPLDYFSPVPDLAILDQAKWPPRFHDHGLDFNDTDQIKLIDTVISTYFDEYRFDTEPSESELDFYRNPWFGPVDAAVMYGLIRHHRPQNIIEVGAGFSTRLIAAACRRNLEEFAQQTMVVSIDPSPRTSLEALSDVVRLDSRAVECVPPEEFMRLRSDDMLIIDSSHVVRSGGDVVFLILNVLPLLKPGVLIHIHDIYLPLDYPREFMFQYHWNFTEQYLIHAFLLYNREFEVVWSSPYMDLEQRERVHRLLGATGGSSLWIRRCVADSDS